MQPPVINCDQPQSKLLSITQAQQKIIDLVSPVTDTEMVPLKSALSRVLADPISSSLDIPGFDNSAMDGYAISSQCLNSENKNEKITLTLIGQSFAGAPYQGAEIEPSQCIRIMTGAMMPKGCDAVVMQEQVKRGGDKIVFDNCHCAGENVRYRGEDLKTGDSVLAAGKLLKPADLGLLAAVGQSEISVYRKVKIGFFSTGDELKSISETLEPGQIYDSNRYLLDGMLSRLQVKILDLGVIPDDKDIIKSTLNNAAESCDVIITSGGVSVGDADFVKQVLDEIGEIHFWRVAMKPGKPLAIGTIKQCTFFGLPGNPVSVFATFYQFALAALYRIMGADSFHPVQFKAKCLCDLKKAPGRAEFQRGKLRRNDLGELEVDSTGGQGSHLMTTLSQADCFIMLNVENAGVKAGEMVDVQPFYGLI